jgi:ABC-type Na+ efflux pump permease subunit
VCGAGKVAAVLLLGVAQWVWIALITAFVLLAVAALARHA